ncbi:hypothetical protein LOZ58_002454 [Ophidiomyces ophidiicola]|nr:hypothetical protein LOZ58_002454 [Ophidiomyces ophidiicola]
MPAYSGLPLFSSPRESEQSPVFRRDEQYFYPPHNQNQNIIHHHFTAGNGRFSFTSTTYRSPRSSHQVLRNRNTLPTDLNTLLRGSWREQRVPEPGENPLPNFPERRTVTMEEVFRIVHRDLAERSGMYGGPQTRVGGTTIIAPNPIDIVAQIMGFGPNGDAVYSQEELDFVVTQLINQTTISNAPGPASEEAIRALPKKPVDKTMLDSEGRAECSICMDSVELKEEVAELPCKHWFHELCISSWLKEHDTCPHCRRGIMPPQMVPLGHVAEMPSQGDNTEGFTLPGNNSTRQSGSTGTNRFSDWMRNRFGGGGSNGG